MNAINRLDILLSDILKTEASTSTNGISQGASIQPLSKLTFSECKSYPSSVFSSAIITTVPLPPHRNSSSLKHHHSDQSDKQKQYKPLLNSSTLDDLFRALTLECEQYLAATTSSYQNKTSNQMIIQPPSSKIQASVESNDDDYENLHTLKTSQSITKTYSPLKTSIEVISPIKRHVVSITITSRVSSPPTIKPSCNATTSTIVQATNHHSSDDDDAINISSSSTNRKRRRRARKQIVSSSITRSSSSSNERKKIITDKKPIISKRSCSTDPRYQRNKTSYDNDFISCSSSQKQRTKRPYRRDISLQHSLTNSERYYENHSSPLSVLLTSTKITSDDFFDNTHQRQQRRSRFESVNHKPSTLIDRMHQQLYQPSTIRNHHNNNNNNNSNKKNTNIPTHRTPSYPVY